jgi:hypothetical protein
MEIRSHQELEHKLRSIIILTMEVVEIMRILNDRLYRYLSLSIAKIAKKLKWL